MRERLRAALIDEALVGLIVFLLAAMALQTGVLAVLAVPAGRMAGPVASWLGVSVVPLTVGGLAVVSWLLIRLTYRILGTGSPSGQTPGKRAAGLRVVSGEDGRPPGYAPAAVRELVLALEVVTVVGLAGALRTPSWHDRAAGTRVVTVTAP